MRIGGIRVTTHDACALAAGRLRAFINQAGTARLRFFECNQCTCNQTIGFQDLTKPVCVKVTISNRYHLFITVTLSISDQEHRHISSYVRTHAGRVSTSSYHLNMGHMCTVPYLDAHMISLDEDYVKCSCMNDTCTLLHHLTH